MANAAQLRSNLKDFLIATFGIPAWDAIQSSMLPKDVPKGYFQLVEADYGPVSRTTWLVGIGVAAVSLEALWLSVDGLLDVIEASMVHPKPCLAYGSLDVRPNIQVEIPDSYVNQGGISTTTGFRTAITFQVVLTSAR